MQGPTVALSRDQHLSRTLSLYRDQDELSALAMMAKVVSVAEDRFAVEFSDVDQELKQALSQCLVNEACRPAGLVSR